MSERSETGPGPSCFGEVLGVLLVLLEGEPSVSLQ